MKRSLVAFPVLALALACAVFSQDKPNSALNGRDSMLQMMPAPGQGVKGACMVGKDEMCAMKRGMMPSPRECSGNFASGGCCCMQGQHQMLPSGFMFRHPVRFHLCILALLMTMALVNILLTILVCMDMAQLGRFNALWIPILLVFGIPGTALYALFRIGDSIRAAGK